MTTAVTLDRLREIVRPNALSSAAHSTAGYLDLLPPPSDQPQRGAQRAMNNPVVAAVYEGPWRWGQTVAYTGITPAAERRRAAPGGVGPAPARHPSAAGCGLRTRQLHEVPASTPGSGRPGGGARLLRTHVAPRGPDQCGRRRRLPARGRPYIALRGRQLRRGVLFRRTLFGSRTLQGSRRDDPCAGPWWPHRGDDQLHTRPRAAAIGVRQAGSAGRSAWVRADRHHVRPGRGRLSGNRSGSSWTVAVHQCDKELDKGAEQQHHRESDNRDQRFHHRPRLERLAHTHTEILLDQPESGVVHVREEQ